MSALNAYEQVVEQLVDAARLGLEDKLSVETIVQTIVELHREDEEVFTREKVIGLLAVAIVMLAQEAPSVRHS